MNKFIASLLAKIKSQYTAEALEPIFVDPFTIWGDKKKIPSTKAMESYNGWVYACIRAIAEDIAAMELQCFKLGEDNEEVTEHDLLDLLSAPSPMQTGYNLLYKTVAHLELTGNAYWLLSGVKNELDQPNAITLLNVGHVKPLITKGEFPKRLVGYKYRQDQKEYTFQPYEILHFEYPDPNDDFEGVGTVQSIAKWIDADNYAMEVNRRFFLNGARIGGFLESENAVTPQQLDYLTKAFEAIYKGVDSSYKTAALPKGVKYTPAATTPKDMDFNNLGNEMQKRILGGFRVPKSVLGVVEDVNRANAEATNYIFALRTIKPKMDQLISVLNSFFVPRFGTDIFLSYKDPVPENTDLKINEMKAVSANHQIKTVNEIRAENYGLDPVEGGDELSAGPSFGQLMVDNSKGERTLKKSFTAEKKIIKKQQPPVSSFHRQLKRRKAMNEELADLVIKNLTKIKDEAKQIRKKELKDITNSDWEILWKDFAARVGKFENQTIEAFEKFNERQKNIVLNNLESAIVKGIKAVAKKKLFNKQAEVNATIDLMTPIITDLYKTEGEKAADLLGFPEMDITTQEAVKTAIAKRMTLLGESYTQSTLDSLAGVIEAELVKGSSMAEIKDAVSNVYDEWNGWRAEMVAHTETFAAANSATKEAWKETGVVKTIKWYTADDMACEWCGPMDGKTVGVEDNFFDKGSSLQAGDKTLNLDYDDVGAPPLHVNCRCYIKPEEISIED